jgi:proteasome accessory factor C
LLRTPVAAMRTNLSASDRVILLLALIPYLQDHGPTPITQLATTFEVEPKVLRGLAEFLGTAGVPGETQTYQHEDLFDIDWNALEYADVLSLVKVVAVDDTPRFSATETAALIAGLHVLASMLPDDDTAFARSAADKLAGVVDEEFDAEPFVVSVSNESLDPCISVLAGAISRAMRVSFTYRDASGRESVRTVEPLHLSQNVQFWYLRGFCLDRGDERSFRLDRMTRVHALAEQADHRESASKVGDTPDSSMWTGSQIALRVRQRALASLAGYGAEIVGSDADGWTKVQIEVAHTDTAAYLAAMVPGEIFVESPHSARLGVAAWAERALAQYDE